jgi:uncharacterized glyoxalase superfamily protein PhnB
VSFHIKCSTKEEVDAIWERLSPGGKVLMPLDRYPFSERYGWLEDKYGLSWQVISAGGSPIHPKFTPELMFVGNVCGKAEEAIEFYVSVFRNAPDGEKPGRRKRTFLRAMARARNQIRRGPRGTRTSRFSGRSETVTETV